MIYKGLSDFLKQRHVNFTHAIRPTNWKYDKIIQDVYKQDLSRINRIPFHKINL